MYDDAWYNSFVPKAASQSTQPAKPRRVATLLKQTDDSENKINDGAVDLEAAPLESFAPSSHGPPQATVARRAKSYTDFFYAARAHLKSHHALDKARRRSVNRLDLVHHEVENELDLNAWHQGVSDDLLESSDDRYRLHRDQLRLIRRHLDSLIHQADRNLEVLASVSSSFLAVDAQTSVFQSRSDGLVAEHQRLSSLADKIESNLRYYNYLEPLTRRLNAPGAGNFVRRDDFSEMLTNLDNCLGYLKEHPGHREAIIYQSRYRLLMTRALTLIRVHVTDTLREIAADAAKRIANRQLNDTTLSSLLYARFRVNAPELKKLSLEIQKRALPAPDAEPGSQPEYQSLMNELYQSYTAARGRLLLPIVTKKMDELSMATNAQKDLVLFARSSISYMRGICLDESELWHEWFEGDGGLYEFLEAMCEPLFDRLRPRTIHETELLKLCEVCTLLQTRYMGESEDESDNGDTNQLDFAYLIRPALEDAQTRLVFLSQTVLRNDIERFKPKAEDLNYPSRNESLMSGNKNKTPVLSGTRNDIHTPQTPAPKTPVVVEDGGTEYPDLQWGFDVHSSFQSWYPTLQKAIWLLSRIYQLVNSSVFDDLAHQIVHHTTLSLSQAAVQISAKTTPVDGQLFLLQHLLILKQQIVAFDIEFVTPEISFDFSNVTNTFWELRERGSLFNPINIMRAIGGGGLIPRVVENMLDAKVELDGRLRTVIKDFTNDFATRMTTPLSEDATKKKGFEGGPAVKSARLAIEKNITTLRQKLDEYLDDKRTKETLVGAVQMQTLRNYEAFLERQISKSHQNGSMITRHGKGKENDVWDADTFADWMDGVFGVERVDLEEDDERAASSGNVSDIGSG